MDESIELEQAEPDKDTVRDVLADIVLELSIPSSTWVAMTTRRLKTVVITVADASYIAPVADALENRLDRPVVIRRLDAKRSDAEGWVAKDRIAEGRTVIYIATSFQHIPVWFRTSAHSSIALPPIDASHVATLMKSACKGRVNRAKLQELKLSLLDFDEVAAVVEPGSGASGTLKRLAGAIERKTARPSDDNLPDMQHAVEYGHAREWALDLKADVDAYLAGEIAWDALDRGCVLDGPPGSGKTLFAKSLAQHLGLPLVQSNLAELFAGGSGYLHSIVAAQREVFAQARAAAPCVLFIDEIDQVPNLDAIDEKNKDYWAVVVADMLIMLDGSNEGREGVIVIGATNRAKSISPALLRVGRLERTIRIGPPPASGIERIIRHHARGNLDHAELKTVARICEGRRFTAAQVMELVRSARRSARRQGRSVEVVDLLQALKPKGEVPAGTKERIAVHEAGHCLLALQVMPDALRGAAIGSPDYARTDFEFERYPLMNIDDILAHAAVLLAGRQAELAILGDATTGAGGDATSDLAKAASILAAAETSFGLYGPQWRCEPSEAPALLQIDRELREAVNARLGEAAAMADRLLSGNMTALRAIADALIEHDYLSADAIAEIATGAGLIAPAPAATEADYASLPVDGGQVNAENFGRANSVRFAPAPLMGVSRVLGSFS